MDIVRTDKVDPVGENGRSIHRLANNQGEPLEDVVIRSSPDEILCHLGVKNPYLLFIWITTSVVWALSAMPLMASAFIMDSVCVTKGELNSSALHCVPTDGTINKEFNLVGDRAHLATYPTTAYLVGVTVGSVFLPLLSDRKGRRLVLILSVGLMGVFGCVSAFAPEFYSFTAIRFLQAFFFTGCGETVWILSYESIPIKLRSYSTLIFGMMWVVGYCSVGPVAYLLPNWRHLVLASSLPSVLFAVIYLLTLPESFHYMVHKGKLEKVGQWMLNANRWASWCGTPQADKELALKMTTEAKVLVDERKASGSKFIIIRQLFTNRTILIHTFVMVYLWACNGVIYYGMSLFSSELAGNRYVNFILTGLIEIPSYLVSPFLLNKMGRRLFVSACHLLAAISFFATALTVNPTFVLLWWLLGKFAISCSFTSLFVYASEVFPTAARNGCIGICSIMARIGGAVAPSIRMMSTISPAIPTLFFGVCAGMGAALSLVLPETLNRALPDSPEQMASINSAGDKKKHTMK